MEYLINDKPNPEISHKSSSILLYVFILIVPCILAVVFYRQFGSKVAAWYLRHANARGDENASSITASYKGSTSSSNSVDQKTKKNANKKTKKSSFTSSGIQTSLLDDVDDEDYDMGSNGNIALKNQIYTEL